MSHQQSAASAQQLSQPAPPPQRVNLSAPQLNPAAPQLNPSTRPAQQLQLPALQLSPPGHQLPQSESSSQQFDLPALQLDPAVQQLCQSSTRAPQMNLPAQQLNPAALQLEQSNPQHQTPDDRSTSSAQQLHPPAPLHYRISPIWLQRALQIKNRARQQIEKIISGQKIPVTVTSNNHLHADLFLAHSLLFADSNLIGVFTREHISINKNICSYDGWIVKSTDLKVIQSVVRCDTAITINSEYSIIGFPDHWGSLVNCAVHAASGKSLKANTSFHYERGITYVRAERNIKPDEELLISYGNSFWSATQRYCQVCSIIIRKSQLYYNCSGMHLRDNHRVPCPVQAHVDCAPHVVKGGELVCYLCTSPDSGMVGVARAADDKPAALSYTSYVTLETSSSSSQLLLPQLNELPPAAEYCINRVFIGCRLAMDGAQKNRKLADFIISQLPPTLYVLSAALRHLNPNSSTGQQLQTARNELADAFHYHYEGNIQLDDCDFLYEVAARHQSHPRSALAKKSLADVQRCIRTMSKDAAKLNRTSKSCRKFTKANSDVWLRTACSGDAELVAKFRSAVYQSIASFLPKAAAAQLDYNSGNLKHRLTDGSIDFAYVMPHFVYWVTEWSNVQLVGVPADVIQQSIQVMSSWLWDHALSKESGKASARRLWNHEIWSEISIAVIVMLRSLPDELQFSADMKHAYYVVNSYRIAVEKCFSDSSQEERNTAPAQLSLFVPGDFGRVSLCDVDVHTHLVLGWFLVVVSAYNLYLTQRRQQYTSQSLYLASGACITKRVGSEQLHHSSSARADSCIKAACSALSASVAEPAASPHPSASAAEEADEAASDNSSCSTTESADSLYQPEAATTSEKAVDEEAAETDSVAEPASSITSSAPIDSSNNSIELKTAETTSAATAVNRQITSSSRSTASAKRRKRIARTNSFRGDKETSLKIATMQRDHIEALSQCPARSDGRKLHFKLQRAKKQAGDPETFEQLEDKAPPQLVYLNINHFYYCFRKVQDCCGNQQRYNRELCSTAGAISPIFQREIIYRDRLNLRVTSNWSQSELNNWIIKKLVERLKCPTLPDGLKLSIREQYARRHSYHELSHICDSCFCNIYGIAQSTYRSLKEKVALKGLREFVHKRTGTTANRITKAALVASAVTAELQTGFVEPLPDKDKLMVKIERGTFIKKLQQRTAQQDFPELPLDDPKNMVSETHVRRVLKQRFGAALCTQRNHGMARCDRCVELGNRINSAGSALEKNSLLAEKSDHLRRVQGEREVLWDWIQRATRDPNSCMVVLIDGMDQAKTNIPKIRKKAKAVDNEADNLKTRITGVLVFGGGGPPRLYLYLTYSDEVHANANLTASIIYDVIEKTKLGIPWAESYTEQQLAAGGYLPKHCYQPNRVLPDELVVQMDNTTKENKNHTVMASLAYLVKMDFFKKVYANFLIVGHTHNEIDRCFSVISQRIRRQDVFTVEQLMDLMRSTVITDPLAADDLNSFEDIKSKRAVRDANLYLRYLNTGLQPYVQLLRRSTDFTAFFTNFTRLEHITKHQQYVFNRAAPGSGDETVYITGRKYAADPPEDFVGLPYIDSTVQLPTELPFLSPAHLLDTERLMAAVKRCVKMNYFSEESEFYQSFVNICNEFKENEEKIDCSTCVKLRRHQASAAAARRAEEAHATNCADEVERPVVETNENKIIQQLSAHLRDSEFADKHPRSKLLIVQQAVTGDYLKQWNPLAHESAQQHATAANSAATSSTAQTLHLASSEGARYQDLSIRMDIGTIVVMEVPGAEWPGYPFYLGRVNKITSQRHVDQAILHVQWFERAYEDDEHELFEWYKAIKIAKEKNYQIAVQLDQLEELSYKKEVEENRHCDAVRRLLLSKSASAAPRAAASARGTKSSARRTVSLRRSRRQVKAVNYAESSDDPDGESNSRDQHQASNNELTESDLPDGFFQLPAPLDFKHHFKHGQIPTRYIRAKDCHVINDDANIRQWFWFLTSQNYHETQMLASQAIAWSSAENAFIGFTKQPKRGRKKAKDIQLNPFTARSYQLTEKFFTTIVTQFKHAEAKAQLLLGQEEAARQRRSAREAADYQDQVNQLRLAREATQAARDARKAELTNLQRAADEHNELLHKPSASIIRDITRKQTPAAAAQQSIVGRTLLLLSTDRLMLVDHWQLFDHSGQPKLHRVYKVLNSHGDGTYDVNICRNPSCSCIQFQQKRLRCKHIYFVLIRVLRCVDLADDSCKSMSWSNVQQLDHRLQLLYRGEYHDGDLRLLFSRSLIQPSPAPSHNQSGDSSITAASSAQLTLAAEQHQSFSGIAARTNSISESASSTAGTSFIAAREPSETDVCCICFETVTLSQYLQQHLVFCKVQCGNNFHRICFQHWRNFRRQQNADVTCPMCRARWM